MKTPELNLPDGVTVHGGNLRIAFRPKGFKRQLRVGLRIPPTKKNIKAAELKLAAIKHEINVGGFEIGNHFPDHPLAKDKPVTVWEVMQKFYRDDAKRRGLSDGTLADIDTHMDVVESSIKNLDIKSVKRSQISKVREAIEKHTTAGQAARILMKLKTACGKAVTAEMLEHNPFTDLSDSGAAKKPPKVLKPEDVFSMEEAATLVEHARLISEELGNVLQFAFWTGARPGEIVALEKADVELPYINVERSLQRKKKGDPFAIAKLPKTQAGIRRILLPKKAIEAVEAQMAIYDGQRLFSNGGKPYNIARLVHSTTWKRLTQRSIGRTLPQYRTRHSFISWMVSAGENQFKIAQHVGHRNTEMLQKVYATFIPRKDPSWILDE